MKVYTIDRTLADWDGWHIGSSMLIGTFLSEERAREYLYNLTEQDTAWNYGWASVPTGKNSYQYFIHDSEVIE